MVEPEKTGGMNIQFQGGINIAIKIPKAKYESTVAFYRDILKLDVQEREIKNPTVSRTHEVKFGLASKGINTCDELEEIPEDTHWIMDPAGTVFILRQHDTKYTL